MRVETRDDRVLGGLVDRGRVVAALTASQDRLSLDSRRQPLEHVADVRHAEPADGEPVGHGSSSWKSKPDSGLGKK